MFAAAKEAFETGPETGQLATSVGPEQVLRKILAIFLDALASLDFTLVSKSVGRQSFKLRSPNHVIDLTQI